MNVAVSVPADFAIHCVLANGVLASRDLCLSVDASCVIRFSMRDTVRRSVSGGIMRKK